MAPLRIGIIGCGGICRSRHIPGLKQLDGVEIVCVANRSRESSERAAREHGIPDVCEDWRELVARDNLDAVLIGTWPYMHREMSVAALTAGKHVFCQARMAMDAAEARAMCAAADAAGKVAMLCPVPIGLSVDATIARIMQEGWLGALRLVQVISMSEAFVSPETPMTWRKDRRLSGKNMHTLGMYIEVIHRWFGETVAVSAQTQTFIHERTTQDGARATVEIPDQILAHATMRSGLPVTYTISTVVHHGLDSIEIHGTEGTLRYVVARDTLYIALAGDTLKPVAVAPEDVYDPNNWKVEADFVNAIRHGTPYAPTFVDGLRYMEVIDAIHASAQRGAAIRLDAAPV